jgi:hypothetical protein
MTDENEQSIRSRGSTFRAGDVVHHVPSGEDWQLACDEADGRVQPMGWPECAALASDCRMVEAATNERRLSTLRFVAGSVKAERIGDSRQRLAAYQLSLEEK